MEIIKKGSLPSEKEIKTTCRNCGTVFKFKAVEAELVFDRRDGNFYKIDCPLCKTMVTVSQK